ncbi:unnamed protein product [Mycena citricolor]|uniref:Uncharacterized protein n=1 Tax=Mycena citricolor TaxID=2018698 RepID=A0AAD2JXK1_9AGAR|nr:unnamed protein product [Mycena citricolor]
MTDLTYCYLHMSHYDLMVIDTLETTEYLRGDPIVDGKPTHLDIPVHMVPPDPETSEVLPSQAHPSYPYGDPTDPKHPASRPRPPYDPQSRALYEDMGYAGGGVNGAFRWRDLALSELLPLDPAKEEAVRAIEARKMASGATATAGVPQAGGGAQEPAQEQDRTIDEEDAEDDEDENAEDEEEEDGEGDAEEEDEEEQG